MHTGRKMHSFHDLLDYLNWPVAVLSTLSLPWLWLGHLWEHMPGMTGVYTVVTILFMLFQMADKLGWLERLKRRKRGDDGTKF